MILSSAGNGATTGSGAGDFGAATTAGFTVGVLDLAAGTLVAGAGFFAGAFTWAAFFGSGLASFLAGAGFFDAGVEEGFVFGTAFLAVFFGVGFGAGLLPLALFVALLLTIQLLLC